MFFNSARTWTQSINKRYTKLYECTVQLGVLFQTHNFIVIIHDVRKI